MKKIILFILFSFGLLWNYFIGFKEAQALYQNDLVEDAITTNNTDFFLKFNSQYNDIPVYYSSDTNGDFYLYEIFSGDKCFYNIILSNLNETMITNNSDTIDLTIKGSVGETTFELSSSQYLNVNIYIIAFSLDDVKEDIGDKITNVTLKNQSDESLLDFNCNITLAEEFDTTNFTNGFSSAELKDLYTLDSVGSIYLSLLKYTVIYCGIVGIYIITKYFIDKRNG